MDRVEIAHGPAREYLIAFGVAAIYVATIPAGEPCEVGFSCDLEFSRRAVHQRWHWATEFVRAYWVKDRASARLIARAVKDRSPRTGDGKRLAITVAQACRAIEEEAARYRLTITEHAAAMGRVRTAVERVTNALAVANGNGGLQWFNQYYRDWRIAARKVGRGMSYLEARARLRRALVLRVARTGEFNLAPDLLAEIFPKISQTPRELQTLPVDDARK